MNAGKSRSNRYDGKLQMFCDTAREADLEALRFVRWLVEQGRLEHGAAGPPTGEYAEQTLGAAA
jgi:hypothetical protein